MQPGDAILIVGAERMNAPGSERWDVRVLSRVDLDTAHGRTRAHWDDPLGSADPFMGPASVGVEVHAFRLRTALFGHNAPDPNLMGNDDSNVAQLIDDTTDPNNWQWNNFQIDASAIDLDTDNAKITAGSWFALVSNEPGLGSADLPGYIELYHASSVIHQSRTAFAISGKITRITPDTTEHLTTSRFPVRRTLVLAQSEPLATVDTPLFHPVYGDALTLGLRMEGLRPGQPIALSGPRQRIAIASRATGVSLVLDDGGSVALTGGDELFLLAPAARLVGSAPVALSAASFGAQIGRTSVRLRLRLVDRDGRAGTLISTGSDIRLAASRTDDPTVSEIAGIATSNTPILLDRDQTRLTLQAPVAHVYERATLRVNANVAPATHGETIEAILGSGDGGAANQAFALGQAPLTYVSASTPSGRASTLEVRVGDILWAEVPTLYNAPVDARQYDTSQNDDAITTVRFGDGLEGARLPSGESNLRVRHRKGLGTAGNMAAGKLTTLLSRPLGVSEVINPAPATGGEAAETLDRARDNAPLTVLTLERAVSIDDYAHFARAFAGIDKAHALWIPVGPARGVFLTIAGVDGADVPEASGPYRNLRDALTAYGDPLVPLRITNYTDARFRCRLSIKVLPEFDVDRVLDGVDTALRDQFSFTHRRFGQTVSVDDVTAVAQGVTGVEAVHVVG